MASWRPPSPAESATPSDSAASPQASASSTTTVTKKRKSTFIVRKEEKQRLEEELARLRTQCDQLQQQASIRAAIDETHALPPGIALRERHFALHGLRSMLSSYFSSSAPPDEAIHLPADKAARHALLMSCSGTKINIARRLVLERIRFLDITKLHNSQEWFELENNEYCSLQFDVTQLRGLNCGVRDVYDAICDFLRNVEIFASEHIGDITIREDDEVEIHEDGVLVSQGRIVSNVQGVGMNIDANIMRFSQYFAPGTSEALADEHAVVCSQSVESDELYPYVPSERVRHDISNVWFIRQVPSTSGEPVLAIVSSKFIKRHHGGPHVLTEAMQAPMRELGQQWGGLMLEFLRERLQTRARRTGQEVIH